MKMRGILRLLTCCFILIFGCFANAWSAPSCSNTYSSCQSGFYLNSSKQCVTCTSGCTCAGGTAQPQCKVTCSAGYYKNSSNTCTQCPANSYCPGGTWDRSSSNAGLNSCNVSFTDSASCTYTSSITGGTKNYTSGTKSRTCYHQTSSAGSSSSSQCTGTQSCGSYGSCGSGSHTSTTCSAGYYKNTSNTCTQCPANSYCPGGTWNVSSSNAGLNSCNVSFTDSASCTYTSSITGGTKNYSSGTKSRTCYHQTSSAGSSSSSQCSGTQSCGSYGSCGSGSHTSTTCSAGYYKNSSNTCSACEAGYYCPGGTWNVSSSIAGRTACSNKPSNSSYTGSATSNSCPWSCNAGYYGSSANGNSSCSACGSGNYCTGGTNRVACSTTVKAGSPTPTSITSLSNGSWSDYDHAVKSSDCICNWYLSDTTRTQYLNQTACTNGPSGYNYTHYNWCRTGYYAADPLNFNEWYNSCKACTNKPANSYYTSYSTPSTMYAVESNCPWSCDANYYKNGSACSACSGVSFSESATCSRSESITGGTKNYSNGSKSRTCYRTTSPAGSTSSSACSGSANCGSYGSCGGGSHTSTTCSAGYYKNTSNTCTQCEAGYYCPGGTWDVSSSIAGRNNCASSNGANGRPQYSGAGASSCTECPAVTGTYASRATGSYAYYPSVHNNGANGCYAYFTDSDSNATFSTLCYYNSTDGAYGGANSGCQIYAPSACAAGYYSTISSRSEWVSAGSYAGCKGVDCMKDKVCTAVGNGYYSANGSTTRSACPTAYPNSGAGAGAITSCYSNTKSRAWTGSQTPCVAPTGCSDKTCDSCSIAACDYVAYSNANGNGDGSIKSGCSTNNASCQQTVKSVTADINHYVDGTSCPACSSFSSTYTKSDGGSISSNYCYAEKTNTGSQVNGSTPANCASVTAWNSCTPGTCTYKDYYNATDTTCTPTNCEKTPKTVTAKSGYYVDDATCPVCPTDYPNSSDGNSGGAAACYTNCGAGTYVSTANAACTNVGIGYYKDAHSVNYGSTSERNQCPVGLITIGYGTGADEEADCGRKLHVGDEVMYLRSVKKTTPSLNVDINNDGIPDFFGNMSTVSKTMSDKSSKSYKTIYNGSTYYIYDDSKQ